MGEELWDRKRTNKEWVPDAVTFRRALLLVNCVFLSSYPTSVGFSFPACKREHTP